jgi:putative transposase
MAIKAHKIRLNPTPEQMEYLKRAAGTRRFCYNWGLAEWNQQHAAGEKPSALKLKEQFNAIRQDLFPWTYEVSKSAVEGAFFDLGDAFNRFFAGQAQYPKFKKKNKSHESFYLANDRFTLGAHWVEPQVVGEFVATQRQISATNKQKHRLGRINLAERLRFAGKIVGASVSTTAGHWSISIQVEVQQTKEENSGPILGVDVGIKELAIVSDTRRFENQRPLTSQLKELKRLQRKASKKQLGSKNRAKANLKVARLHDEIACIREDAHHKLTTGIARTCSAVGLEDLHVKGMMKNRRLARAMADAGWGQLRTFFEQKMAGVNGKAVFVDRFYPSTKTCSGCGHVKKRMPLKYRTYICMACGLTIDRDLNAAINLEYEARRILRDLAA